jgi:hypothetical protein
MSHPKDDLFIISIDGKTKQHTWTKAETKGKTPRPRYMHSFDHYPKQNVIIMFGGRND